MQAGRNVGFQRRPLSSQSDAGSSRVETTLSVCCVRSRTTHRSHSAARIARTPQHASQRHGRRVLARSPTFEGVVHPHRVYPRGGCRRRACSGNTSRRCQSDRRVGRGPKFVRKGERSAVDRDERGALSLYTSKRGWEGCARPREFPSANCNEFVLTKSKNDSLGGHPRFACLLHRTCLIFDAARATLYSRTTAKYFAHEFELTYSTRNVNTVQ